MRNPRELFELTPDAADTPAGLELVVALTGFTDAGGAAAQFTEFMLGSLDTVDVAVFDNDLLLDYRARRPVIYFDQDHLSDYTPPSLKLSLAYDDLGAPFLLLTGYEPDFAWEGFVEAVVSIATELAVSGVTWVHAIPMPVPHTRPIGVTVSGTRQDLIESLSVWRPHTQVPANVLHLMELRLTREGVPVVGFAILIPHYLADTEYPFAVVSAIDSVGASTGLILPTDSLREDGREFLGKVNEQVSGNAELARLIETLEQRYDAYMEGNAPRSPLTDPSGEVPSADDIAEELERFLQDRRGGEDRPFGSRFA